MDHEKRKTKLTFFFSLDDINLFDMYDVVERIRLWNLLFPANNFMSVTGEIAFHVKLDWSFVRTHHPLAFFLKYTHENLIPIFFWVETSTFKLDCEVYHKISTWLSQTYTSFSIPIKFLASLESGKLFHCNQLWKFALDVFFVLMLLSQSSS